MLKVQGEDERQLEDASSVGMKATGQSSAPGPGLQPSTAHHVVKTATVKITDPGKVTGSVSQHRGANLPCHDPSLAMKEHWP